MLQKTLERVFFAYGKECRNQNDANPIVQLPLVCTRGVVVFPNQEVIIDVGREKSTRAVEEAQEKYESQVVLVAQRDLALEEPDVNDVYSYGTLCQIKHIRRMVICV